MTKKTNTESQKSKFYDASEILKHEQDGTKYELHITEGSIEERESGILARQYEDMATAIYEEAQESFFADDETRYEASLIYRSKMIKLETWRHAQIKIVLDHINECLRDLKQVKGEEKREMMDTLRSLVEELDALVRLESCRRTGSSVTNNPAVRSMLAKLDKKG